MPGGNQKQCRRAAGLECVLWRLGCPSLNRHTTHPRPAALAAACAAPAVADADVVGLRGASERAPFISRLLLNGGGRWAGDMPAGAAGACILVLCLHCRFSYDDWYY
jgi:hypothetical protein